MIKIKTADDIKHLQKAGKISSEILNNALRTAKPGVTTLQLNNYVEDLLVKNDSTSWFKEVSKYPYATCISVNDVWVHGMPNETVLEEGDIVSLDIGVKHNGYYVDHCWTIPVSKDYTPVKNIFDYTHHNDPTIEKFLKVGMEALANAISQFKENGRIGDISSAMQTIVETNKYSVIRDYTGHGVGFSPHEEPQITCFGSKGAGSLIKKGMVFAIEIMYSMGSPIITTKSDGWSVASKDGSLTGMFEHTVALTDNGPIILTI